MGEFIKKATEYIINFFETTGWTIVSFLAVLVLGIIAIRLLTMLVKRILLKSPIENTLCGFISTLVTAFLWLCLVFILGAVANIPLTPLVTALGAVAIAIGLALKDSLANLANGVVLIGTKPFMVGDFVEIGGITGTVRAIHMLSTEVITVDNKKITIPNSQITAASVINYSAKPTRRIDWVFSVGYSSDVTLAKKIILQLVKKEKRILLLPAPIICVSELGNSAVKIAVKSWVSSGDYWSVLWKFNEDIFFAFKNNGIEIPYEKLSVSFEKDMLLPSSIDASIPLQVERAEPTENTAQIANTQSTSQIADTQSTSQIANTTNKNSKENDEEC